MYITIKSLRKTLGKHLEQTDLFIGIPMLIVFLILFAIESTRLVSICFLVICLFLMIPLSFSKKNRMYKIMFLVAYYLFKGKDYCYFQEYKESKVSKINEIIQKVQS